jgi:WD40 repeat protein
MFRFAALLLCCASASAAPPEPTVLKGHAGWVSAVAFSPDGSRLAVASADNTVSVWDTATWKETLRLKGHTDYVSAVAWSPNGKQLLSGSFDHTAKLWDAKTGAEKLTLKGHKGAVMAVAVLAEGVDLVTTGIDGTARGERPLTGERTEGTLHLSWVNALAIGPKGQVATASSDNTILTSGSWERHTLKPKAAEIRSLSFAPDGERLAAGTRYGITKVWNAKGEEVASLKGKHTGDVWGVSFGAGGKLLAVADGDWNKPSDVVLWDTTTWKEKARLAHTNEVLCVACHPTKPLVAAGAWDKTVRVWDVSEWAK